MNDDPLALCGREINGRYRIERLLGVGGMGVVYAATQVEHATPCALKMIRPAALPPGDREQIERRFHREARLGLRVRHEGLVAVHDQDRLPDGTPFYAMELLSGRSLWDVLVHGGPLPWECAAELGMQAAAALRALHDARVVHRDLKPANLQVLDDGRLKVLDLGIAHSDPEDVEHGEVDVRTFTGQMMGTPPYMAPEQMVDAKRADLRADIYALGLVLFELCTGVQPFRGKPPLEVFQLKLIPGMVPPLRRFSPAAHPLFETLLHQMVDEVERRPASMREVMAGLARILPADRLALRQRLAGHARDVPLTPLPLWSGQTLPDVAQQETVSDPRAAGPVPVQVAGTIEDAGGAGPVGALRWRWMGMIGSLGLVVCLPGASVPIRAAAPAVGTVPAAPVARVVAERPVAVASAQGPASAPGPGAAARQLPAMAARVSANAPVRVAAARATAPPPAATAPPVGPAARASAVPATAPRRQHSAAPGKVRVAVRPFAEIYLDGVHQSEGSPHTYTVPAGNHTVRAINTALGQDESRVIKVIPGATVSLAIDWGER